METRPTIGTLIIAHNEVANIARAVDSVAFSDQVVVVDSCSDDDTVAIARARGAEVHVQPWLGYSAQKQLALSFLTTDWVLWIDADEEVSSELRAEIQIRLRRPVEEAGFRIPRLVRYLGRWIHHGGWYPDPKLRLFRRDAGQFDGRLVHEGVDVEGPIGELRGALFHFPYRDIDHHREKVERYGRLAAEQLRREGRRVTVLDRWFRPANRFLRQLILQGGFLDGRPGWVAAWMSAHYARLKYRAWPSDDDGTA